MTVPHTLHPIILQNQKVCYNILFKAVSQTLAELSEDKKYLGAKTGFTSILHTWGQNLMFHPHIHYLEFLQEFENFLTTIYKQEWVVYCKPPFKTAATVVEYLGRYTHRVAISNNCILDCNNGNVAFKWRDYKDKNEWKVMTITAEEFIRRFLLHVLPSGFMKIRHYGILGNRSKTKKFNLCNTLTNTPIIEKTTLSTAESIEKLIGKKAFLCPCCKSDKLSRYAYYST